MNYYIDLFSPETARYFSESDRKVTGFRITQKKYVKNKAIAKGDKFICYVTKLQRFIGVLEVVDEYFISDKSIFVETGKEDPFTLRFNVKPIVWLPIEYAVPIHDDILWKHLSFTKILKRGSNNWTNKVFASPRLWQAGDCKYIEKILSKQARSPKEYFITPAEQRVINKSYSKSKNLSRNAGDRFQNKMADLFERSGFRILVNNLVKQGPDIVVEDPVTNARIIVQCKHTASTKTYPSIRRLINEYATEVRDSDADIAILALDGFHISGQVDYGALKEELKRKKIILWNTEIINHYMDLAKTIGLFTKYQILSDLGLKKDFDKDKRFQAFRVCQDYELNKDNNYISQTEFIVARISPEWLIKAATVNRRINAEDGPVGYQRVLERSRVKNIASFLSKDNWVLPNTIILCTTDVLNDRPLEVKSGYVRLPSLVGSLWVMDGQHRLYSFSQIKDPKDLRSDLVCVIFDSKSMGESAMEKQANIFVDININAKRVKTSLLLDLMSQYKLINVKNNKGLRVVQRLAKLTIFKNLISGLNATKNGSVNLTAVVKSVNELCNNRNLIVKDAIDPSDENIEDACYSYLESFFKIVYDNYLDEWNNPNFVVTSDRGFRGLIKLYIRILETKGSSKSSLSTYTGDVILALKESGFDFSSQAFKGQYLGEGGATVLLEDMSAFISKKIKGFPSKSKILSNALPLKEDEVTEFKSSLRWDYNRNIVDKGRETDCLKTICAFANSDGGVLYIGVDDNGEVKGIENDFKTLSKKNRDGFDIHLNNILKERLSPSLVTRTFTEYRNYGEKEYCIVKVDRSSEPVYLDNKYFYCRSGATSQPLEGSAIHQYIRSRHA